MDPWQKIAIIVSILTFLRLVYHDIKQYIADRKKKAKQKKRKRFSQKRKRK